MLNFVIQLFTPMQSSSFIPPRYTYQDYKLWKEDWELIEGYPFRLLPSPSAKHNLALVNFIFQGKTALNKNKNCSFLLFSELDWKIDEQTVVRPDMMIVCGKTTADFLDFPPVLVLEMLSPASLKNDRVIKFDLYKQQGVKYYIMGDYLKQTIEVFELIDNVYKQSSTNTFDLDKNCQISFNFDEIWV